MRKIEKVINVYKFNELSESAKEKALQYRMECEHDYYCEFCLKDDMMECGECLLADYFENAKFDNVCYSLSYCQGDGAMIEFSIGIKDFNKKYHVFDNEEMRYLLEKDIIDKIEVTQSGRYCHKYAFNVNVIYNNSYWEYDYEDIKDDYNISESDFNSIDDRLNNAISRKSANNMYAFDTFSHDIVVMNEELEEFGYNSIEHFNDCDNILYLMNDYEYLEDGSVYDE